MTIETQEMEASMLLGEQFERFRKSELGRYLDGRAELKLADLIREMRNLSPLDPDLKVKLAKIQCQMEIYEDYLTWIEELIQDGRNAYEQYTELSQTED
jgi:hypothetical protein